MGDGVDMRYYGEHMVFSGYRAVYVEGTDDEQETPESILPVIKEGSDMAFVEVDAVQHFTQPPARYTEASLVKTLEEKGIGRPQHLCAHHHHPSFRAAMSPGRKSVCILPNWDAWSPA